ncbi:MAG: hypothetical protein QNI93_02615 [Kiloniellales bacterium]|nr:hypothetical protein [Kiloniellales bacterium]
MIVALQEEPVRSDYAGGMSRFLVAAARTYGVHDSAASTSLVVALAHAASPPSRPVPIEVSACRHIETVIEAEELYLVPSGGAMWLSDNAEGLSHSPGSFSHHRPRKLHATRCGAMPLRVAWAWCGNLDFGTYWIEALG